MRRERLERDAERLLRPEPAGEARATSPVEPELGAKLARATAAAGSAGAGFGSTETRSGSSPQRERDVAQVRARAEDVPRAAQRRVPRRAQEPRPHAAADALELVERPGVAAAARRALEHLVGDELHDERPAREARADRGAPDHARRVDDVGAARGRANEQRGPHVPQRRATRRPVHGIRPRRRLRVGRRHDLDRVSALGEEVRERGRMARRAAGIGRPDPGDDDDPHGWSAAPPGRSDARTSARRRSDHDEPGGGEHERRDEDGDRSARRPPLGAEHGDERNRDERLEPVRHDPQPRPPDRDGQRLRPAEREVDRGGEQDDRARRSTAPSYSEPKTTSMSHGIATKKTGTATSMTAPAHFE